VKTTLRYYSEASEADKRAAMAKITKAREEEGAATA